MTLKQVHGIGSRGWQAVTMMLCALIMCASQAGAQRQAQLPWWDRAAEQQIGRYWIKSDLSDAQTRHIARNLNFMYDEYARRVGSHPVRIDEKLNVLLFSDRREYAMTMRARLAVSVEDRRGLFFIGVAGPGLAVCADGLSQRAIDQLTQRENFHLFAHSRFGRDLPAWAGEGLAELFGRSVVVNDGLLIEQAPPRTLTRLKQSVELGEYARFDAMLSMSREEWMERKKDSKAMPVHDQAWSMAHLLFFSENGRHIEQLREYLRHINNGLPAPEAFDRSFAGDIEGFEAQWRRHVFSMQPGAFITALERIEFLALGMLELRRRSVRPESLEALQAALREIDFECEVDIAGTTTRLKATDPDAMTIPMDALCPLQPQFMLEKARLFNLTQRERGLEETDPTPAIIRTEHLRPRNLEIRWRREDSDGAFRYDILLK